MKHLTLVILLALAPLSRGYTFDDGTEFKDPLSTYTFLKRGDAGVYYALSFKGRHGYKASSLFLRWREISEIYVSDSAITFDDFWLGPARISRTTLLVWYEREITEACELSDQMEAAAWLTSPRAKRKI